MTRYGVNRRQALMAGAAAPLAATLAAGGARASAEMMGMMVPKANRITLGGFEVTTLLAGTTPREDPHSIFGLNVDDETFEQVSRDAFLPTDAAQFFFTPTLVNTGGEVILFDTGLNPEGITGALEAAGYTPDQVDTVVLTHMHGDHIGGLMRDGSPTFANASYVTGQVEYDAWNEGDNEGFANNVKPLAEQMTFLDDGGEVASGVTAMAMFGHTPGHMGYMLESDGSQLVVCADFANHYVWSLAHPDWEVLFDMDKEAAAATRRRVLDMLATERVPFIGYHMPFPATGFIEAAGDGFRYVPSSYQLML